MRYIIVAIICCMLIPGCTAGSLKGRKKDTVAIVNGRPITMEMLDKRIASMPDYYRTFASQHKKEALDEMIIEELLYEEAKKRRLDRDSEVKELVKEAIRKVLISKLVENETKKSVPVSDDNMMKYYDENKERYMIPEMVRASHILTNTEEEANAALAELQAGGDFTELAKKYSKDLTKDRGGDLGYFRKGQMIPEFEQACFNLKVGETSNVVKTRFGYHIIKLSDRKEASYRGFEDVKESIRVMISRARQSEKLNQLTQSLRDKAKVKVIDKALISAAPQEQPKATSVPALPSGDKK